MVSVFLLVGQEDRMVGKAPSQQLAMTFLHSRATCVGIPPPWGLSGLLIVLAYFLPLSDFFWYSVVILASNICLSI